jgi:hypothetical protein
MNLNRVTYRARQFWANLSAAPATEDLEQARSILTTEQYELFQQLQPAEQTHAFQVYQKLINQGITETQLLQAALLHDVGKARAPLASWERVAIVLARAAFPQKVLDWGQGKAAGWRRPFAVAVQHPQWGAEMALSAGTEPLTVELIRRHQEPLNGEPQTESDQLLQILQAADDAS